MPTGKGILRQEQEAFPIRLPALAYFNKNDIFTRPLASACNVCVCVCVCVCLYKNCRQPNFQARKLPVQNRRNCVRFQKLHLSYKKSCVPFFVQYIYTLTINPSPPSGCNLNLCKDTTKKAHGQPTSMIFFVRKQNGDERRGRRNKIASPRGPNCEGSQFLTRGPAIYDSGLRKAERVRLPKRKRTPS